MNYFVFVLSQLRKWLAFEAKVAVADSMKTVGLAERVALPDHYFRNDYRLLAEKIAPNFDIQIVDSLGGVFLFGYYADIENFRKYLYSEIERREN